jgi:carboxymethylenebutenolidase
MITEKLEIDREGARVEALFFRPDAVAEFPGVLFYTDIWGIRPANIGMARRLAEQGFAVLMPNVFFRRSPIRENGFEPADENEKQKMLGALMRSQTPAQMESDGAAYADFLAGTKGVKKGKLGVVGYCFTGAMAVRTAAASDRIAAAASFHGGRLATDDPDSPHLQLGRISARLYFGHAVRDQSMTADKIAILEQALRDWHGAFQSETYEGARHGWTVPGRDVYNELQAERAFEKLVELFDATLKAG